MGVPVPVPVNDNPEQDALAAIRAQYQQALVFIQAMKQDEAEIQQDQSILAQLDALPSWIRDCSCIKSAIDKYTGEEDAAKADMKTQGDKLKALDPSFDALCDSLNSLINCIDTAMTDGVGYDNVMGDIANLQPAINKLLEAMKLKLQGDMYFAEMDSNAADQMNASELAALAAEGVSSLSAEAGVLNSVSTSLASLINAYQTAYNKANEDYNSYDFWDDVASFFGGDAEEKKAEDKAIMKNATDMMNGLSNIMTSLAPAIASCMPEFTQVMIVVKEILKEVKKILNDVNMSPKEKQGAVLALVMFLLTFFQVIKQDVATEKTKNNQDMSKGAMQASQMNVDNTLSNEKVKEEQEHNAKIMKMVMLVAEVVLGSIMMALAPGFGTALLVGLVTTFEALQTEGVVNVTGALAGAIGGKNAQIWADTIVAVAEMILTMGGGAALDGLSAVGKAAVEEVVEETMEAAMDIVEKAADAAAQAAGKAGEAGEKAAGLAMNLLDNVCSKAATKAAEGAAEQFMKQPFATLMSMIAKGTFKETLEKTMQKAAEEAIETAIEESATIAKLAARGVESSEDIIEGIATKAANESVASVSGKSVEKVAKEAAATKLGTAASRGLWTAVFAMGNTNMITDMLKKMGVTDDTILEIMQVIQQLIQMIALMFGSGMMSGATIEGVAQSMPRAVNLLSLIPQGANVAGEYGLYQTQIKESKAVTAIAMNGSVADLLHSFIEQLQKDMNLEREIMTKDQTQEAQSTLGMAGHLHDGDNAMVQILISAAG